MPNSSEKKATKTTPARSVPYIPAPRYTLWLPSLLAITLSVVWLGAIGAINLAQKIL
ncbi:hypothetical protein [Thioclava sp. SK-1]|uniref:hypothetical protein n=1 Tax=Thioclava sp. SK-1 TaxID=1889770 RepID=UPI00159F0C9F|nr:hypothetical protein [Thioclava sp. SK-1]